MLVVDIVGMHVSSYLMPFGKGRIYIGSNRSISYMSKNQHLSIRVSFWVVGDVRKYKYIIIFPILFVFGLIRSSDVCEGY